MSVSSAPILVDEPRRPVRLGEMLIERRQIERDDLDRALEIQKERGDKLGKILVDLGFIAMRDVLAALSEQFTATPRQRCLVHKQRNVLNAIPRREQGDVQAELVGIWDQPTKEEALTQLAAFKAKYAQRYPEAVRSLLEDEEHLLTFYDFPVSMHRYLQTTNAIESLFSNGRQRTDQIDVFTTETSCLTIVWATMQDIRLHKISL